MFDAIDNYARRTATKLSNWVLNLPFWPEGAVGERRLRYVLFGLLASDQVLIFLSNWSLPGIAVIMAIFGVAAIAMDANILRAIYKLARKAPAFRPGMDSAESAGLHCGG